MELQKIPKKDLERMRYLFFLGHSVSEIAEISDKDIETIRFYVFGADGSGSDPMCWFQLKKEADKTGIVPFLKAKVDALEKSTGMAYNLLTKGLKDLSERVDKNEYVFTVQELKQVSDIVSSLDKITRLETGKPTDVTEFVSVTLGEAREILRRDPFIDAEYTVVEKQEELEIPDFHSPWRNDENI